MAKFDQFGKELKILRIEKGLTLREICQKVDYDPSNWSRIERGRLSPPSNEGTLKKWANVLGISKNARKLREFIDDAMIAQGIIPGDILSQKDAVKYLPAFFRAVRTKKPNKEEIDKLIDTINNA